MAVTVQAVPCLSDNYAWLLRDTASRTVAICDPGEAKPVIEAIEAGGGRCDIILLTHHHGDHIDGVEEIRARYGAKVIGAAALQGAIFAAVRSAVNRSGAKGYAHLTGVWPGERRPDPE